MVLQERERTHTDIEFSDYLRYPGSFAEIRAGIESWLREAIIVPFSYEGVIEDGKFKSFGQDMVEMAKHGKTERIGQVGYERADADLIGIERIHTWLRDEAQDGDLIILLSPPGTEEEGFGAHGQRRLSFTQFGLARIHGTDRRVRMISIPEKEVSIEQHIGRIEQIWGEPSFVWRRKVERDDRGLVSTPLFIKQGDVGNGIDQYVRLQGKDGWQQVEQELQNGLALQEDENAIQRRRSLIDTIAWQVRKYIDERNAPRLNNIGLVARIVMAREAASKYLNKTTDYIVEEFDKIESAQWYRAQLNRRRLAPAVAEYTYKSPEAVVAYKILDRLQRQLSEEADVREMLMGSSCGGGGIDDFMSGRLEGRGNYLDLLANRAPGLQKEESTSESSTKMECVKCPFCHKTVDAILTSSKIKCPECKAEVSRS